jgi:hypothetical protein
LPVLAAGSDKAQAYTLRVRVGRFRNQYLREPGERQLPGKNFDRLDDRLWPRLCENSRDRFLPVNFSHVDAISGDISATNSPVSNPTRRAK